MALNNTNSVMNYAGNGSTVAFATGFYFLENSDVSVIVGGVGQIQGTDYTLTGALNPSGGTVTFTTAPIAAAMITIFRNTPYTQITTFSDNDALPAASLENGLDKLTMIAQEIRAGLYNIGYAVFTSSGTWTVPANVSQVKVTVVGGGGGGSNADNSGTHGAGGGAGGVSIGYTTVAPGAAIPITVGAGGAGGTTGGNATLSLFGGMTSVGGFGGPATTASLPTILLGGIGGGSGGGSILNTLGSYGGPCSTNLGPPIGFGGSCMFGSGGAPHLNGYGYGAGGGGGIYAPGLSAGGNGAGGLVLIEW